MKVVLINTPAALHEPSRIVPTGIISLAAYLEQHGHEVKVVDIARTRDPLDLAIAERAIKLRRTHRMRLPDAIIWATAQIHQAVLVTRNTKDFHATWTGIRIPYQL